MKRIFPLLVLLSLFAGSFLAAETVMIYTVDSWYTEERRMGEEYIAYALEDGLMNGLFDAGHIIYNDYAPPMIEANYSDRNRSSCRIARSGGAGWLLELKISYEGEGEEINSLPSTVSFRLTDILSDRVVDSGEMNILDFSENSSDSPREICMKLGAALAAGVIEFL